MTLDDAYLDRARDALRAAQTLIEHDHADAAANRAYYACFYAAMAALITVDERPKTHKGTRTRFALHFIQTGIIPPDIGTFLAHAATLRERGDYDAFSVTDTAAAADLVADAERFVSAVAPLLDT